VLTRVSTWAARLQVNGSERGFLSLVNKAFSEKRKMMRNSLQPLFSPEQVAEALTELKLNPMARAQELSLGDFVRFYNRLQALRVKEALGEEVLFEGVELEL
jgi:16S rRNA A1518/A1519 N6-dimethyltransferase RsmA/KsgA/DIM1 with predicted DNA glycosylase/AP lyase activity